MKYLKKNPDSKLLNLKYSNKSERPEIRDGLLAEQSGFCAYSECFIKHTDAKDIEHFNPELKDTPEDDYFNWYTVRSWMNQHKHKKIDKFLPILCHYSDEVEKRIKYEGRFFITVNNSDIEAQNLINFLGMNKYELCLDRINHVKRIKQLKSWCKTDEEFIKRLISDKDNLSFISALEYEFKELKNHIF